MYNGDDAVDTYDANAEDDDDDENYKGDYSGDPEKDVYDFADMMMTYVQLCMMMVTNMFMMIMMMVTYVEGRM